MTLLALALLLVMGQAPEGGSLPLFAGGSDNENGPVFTTTTHAISAKDWANQSCIHGPYVITLNGGPALIGDTTATVCADTPYPIHFGFLGGKVFLYSDDGHTWLLFSSKQPTEVVKFNNGVH